jgi:acetyltransferase-like isoleucine patch superfamily enzyme
MIKYELINLLSSWVPGALGLFLRTKLYPRILRRCGRGVVFGTNVVLRHPHKISIGDNCVIDDNCVLDAKGEDNRGIYIEDNVYIGRNATIYCQNGDIEIGDYANISSNCQIFSAKSVKIGKYLLMAAYCYLIGGGHKADQLDVPFIEQGRIAMGITLSDNIWVGAGVKILDGVNIGKNVILATGAVVTKDVPDYAIAGGIPAKVIRDRRDDAPGES